VVKKDQTSSKREVKTSVRDLMIDDMAAWTFDVGVEVSWM
jgi:hypothetical protein